MAAMKSAWVVCAWVWVALILVGASGQKQINVITPMFLEPVTKRPFEGHVRTRYSLTNGYGVCRGCTGDAWEAYDRRQRTVFTAPTLAELVYPSQTETITLTYVLDYPVKVLRYKIYVGEDTPESLYPRDWSIFLVGPSGGALFHEVKNAEFHNGVFVGKFKNDSKHTEIRLAVTKDSTPGDKEIKIQIAEFEAFGPRGQFDKLVVGGFPCNRAPRYMLQAGAKKGGKAFTNADISQNKLDKMFNDQAGTFNSNEQVTLTRGVYHPYIILGYHFVKAKQVVQFGIDRQWGGGLGFLYDTIHKFPQRRMILEANLCDPSCDYLGEEGWTAVADGTGEEHFGRKWLVERPGFYRAYRLKIERLRLEERVRFGEVVLLQC